MILVNGNTFGTIDIDIDSSDYVGNIVEIKEVLEAKIYLFYLYRKDVTDFKYKVLEGNIIMEKVEKKNN